MQQNKRYRGKNSTGRTRSRNKGNKNYLIIFVIIFAVIVIAVIVKFVQAVSLNSKNRISSETTADSQLVQTTQADKSTIIIEESEKNPGGNKESESSYDYTKPVSANAPVENDYFNDAVFIGDSRTEGLLLYTGLSNAIAYTNKGLMVDTVFTKPVINKDGEKLSVMDALRLTEFSKVYIMLGINETGWAYSNLFIEKYGMIIDEIKKINPEAIIYIQEILPVTESVSQMHSYLKNNKINEYNTLLRQMAADKQVYYIDTGAAVADEKGCLPEEAAADGIHLKKQYCEKWLEYLKIHTVSK